MRTILPATMSAGLRRSPLSLLPSIEWTMISNYDRIQPMPPAGILLRLRSCGALSGISCPLSTSCCQNVDTSACGSFVMASNIACDAWRAASIFFSGTVATFGVMICSSAFMVWRDNMTPYQHTCQDVNILPAILDNRLSCYLIDTITLSDSINHTENFLNRWEEGVVR